MGPLPILSIYGLGGDSALALLLPIMAPVRKRKIDALADSIWDSLAQDLPDDITVECVAGDAPESVEPLADDAPDNAASGSQAAGAASSGCQAANVEVAWRLVNVLCLLLVFL